MQKQFDLKAATDLAEKLLDATRKGGAYLKEAYDQLTPEQKYSLGVMLTTAGSLLTFAILRGRRDDNVSTGIQILRDLANQQRSA